MYRVDYLMSLLDVTSLHRESFWVSYRESAFCDERPMFSVWHLQLKGWHSRCEKSLYLRSWRVSRQYSPENTILTLINKWPDSI